MDTLLLLLACAADKDPRYVYGDDSAGAGEDPPLDTSTLPRASDVDVLVIGAGPAGLAAAIEASRAGASVRVLERNTEVGGSALWAGGYMLFSGTTDQAAAGIVDSPERLLSEWPGFTGGDTTDAWVQALANENVTEVHDWLADLGVRWFPVVNDSSAGPTPRVHPVNGGGGGLVHAMELQLASDIVTLRAEAVALLTDQEDGRVSGARWTDLERGEEVTTTADAVIVATGGFARDLERVREERPDLAEVDLRLAGWTGTDGNGLRLLEGLGAATQNLGAVGLYAHGIEDGDTQEEYVARAITGTPWFNAGGVRFVDESRTNDFHTGTAVATQPDGQAWAFFDVNAFNAAQFTRDDMTRAPRTGQALVEEGILLRADTLDALAARVGLPAESVRSDAQAYDAWLEERTATDPFRTSRNEARALRTPPFYAAPVAVAVSKVFGGIDVDLDGRVLDTDGAVMPGLYAAGELAGMAGGSLVGDHGFTGSLTAVILGGRKAGAAAAAEGLAR